MRTLTALAAAAVVAVTPVQAADRTIRIINKGSEDILHVFAKDREHVFWGRDRLRETLWRGRAGKVAVSGPSQCLRDLRVVTRSGRSAELAQADVCVIREWTIEDGILR